MDVSKPLQDLVKLAPIAMIVAGVAGFFFWNHIETDRAHMAAAQVQAETYARALQRLESQVRINTLLRSLERCGDEHREETLEMFRDIVQFQKQEFGP